MAEPIIYTIPMDFYGGKNAPPAELGATHAAPIESQKVTPAPVATRQPMPAPRQPILPPKQTLVQPAPQTSSNKIIIIAAVIVVILMLIAGGVWYWNNSKTPAPQTLPAVTLATSTPEVVIETPTSTPTSTIEIPVVPTSTVALIPPHVFRDSADSDGDGLTDVEEEMLGTNPTLIDTDSDTYPDRLELVNLFSPVAAGQARLIDSQLVSTYINPDYKYTIYQPTAWIARAVDETTHKDVMFTALSGEFVEITALPFPTGQAFPDWFHQNFPNEVLATYQPFTNRFHVSGIMSPDKTVAFITDGGSVYLIRYDGGTREEINYRSTFVMMVQSFKTATVATPIELLPLTSVGTPTALGVIATSSPEIAIPETTATGPAFMATTSTLPVVVSTSTAATSTLVAPTSTP